MFFFNFKSPNKMENNVINQMIDLISDVDILKSIEKHISNRIYNLQVLDLKKSIDGMNVQTLLKLSIEKENDPIIKEKLLNLIDFNEYRNEPGLKSIIPQEEIEQNGRN
jgi:hypothetical protein